MKRLFKDVREAWGTRQRIIVVGVEARESDSPALLLTDCVTLGKWLNLSVLQSPHPCNGNNNSDCIIGAVSFCFVAIIVIISSSSNRVRIPRRHEEHDRNTIYESGAFGCW